MFANLDQAIKDLLSMRDSREMTVRELADLLMTHLGIVLETDQDHHDFERFIFWISQPDLDEARVVCANIELGRLRVIAARKPQTKKNKNETAEEKLGGNILLTLVQTNNETTDSKVEGNILPTLAQTKTETAGEKLEGNILLTLAQTKNETTEEKLGGYFLPTLAQTKTETADSKVGGNILLLLAHTKDIKDVFKKAGILVYTQVKQYAEQVELFAQQIDAYIAGDRSEMIIAPRVENIDLATSSSIKNDNPGGKIYITVRDLLACIACSQNATALKKLCVYYTAAMMRYLKISGDMKSDMLAEQARRLRESADRTRITKELKDGWLAQRDDEISLLRREMREYAMAHSSSLDQANASLEEVKGQNKILIDGQVEIYNELNKTQRRVPVSISDSNREPCFAVTSILYNHPKNGATVRLFFRHGMYSALKSGLMPLMMGDYNPNRNLVIRAKHKLVIAPVYAPDQRNWAHQAQVKYKELIASRTASTRSDLNKKKTRLRAQIKRLASDVDINEKTVAGKNIGVLNHLILREKAFLAASIPEKERKRHMDKLTILNKALSESEAALAAAKSELEALCSIDMSVPIKFGKMYIDFQTNKYVSLYDIVNIFEEMIVETHGAVYLTSMRDELLAAAKTTQDDLISDLYNNNLKEIRNLKEMVDVVINDSSARLSASMTSFVLNDETADDTTIENQLAAIANSII